MDSLSNKLKSAGFWQALQTVVQVISQFGYMAIMARLLSKADFGLMALANGFIGLGMLFSTAGMGTAIIQRKDATQKHYNAALHASFLISFIVFIIIYFSAPYIANFYNQPELTLIVKVIGVGVVLNSINSVSRSILQKNFRFKATSNITIFVTLTGYTVGIVLGILGYGVWSLIAASLTISLLNAIIMFYYAPVQLKIKFYYKEFKELFSYGFGMILLSINNYLGSGGLNLILGKIMPPAQLGIFERSNQIKTLPSGYLGNILDTIMFPAMSEIQDEKERLFRIYQHSLGMVNTILMPVAFFLIFFSKEVVLILLGDKWLDAVIPLQIMFIVLPFSSSGRMADSVVRATGLIYKNVIRKFIYVIVLIITVSTGAYFYGIIGAAIGVTFSYFFNYGIMLILVKSIFKKRPKEIFVKPILSGLKLALITLTIVLVFTTLLHAWGHESIIKFLIITPLTVITLFGIAWIQPSILGEYLQETIYQLFPKLKKK